LQVFVEPESWPDFLAAYGREHQGWPMALEIMGQRQRRRVPRFRPLHSMGWKNRGSLVPLIAVNFRDGGSASISAPRAIRQLKDHFGYHQGLEIETGEGWIALRFGPASCGLIGAANRTR
jgi:hypothetical protein